MSIELAENGTVVRFTTLNSRGPCEFHSAWLAHYCPCPRCQQQSSGQRLERLDTASHCARVESAQLTPTGLEVRFSADHYATFPLTWLDKHRYDAHTLQQQRSTLLEHRNYLTTMQWSEKEGVDPLVWLANAVNGVCIVENTPTTEDFLLRFIEPSLCEPSHKLYGTTFVVEAVDESINVAYSQHKLEAHQDLAYYESPPGLQFLHCLEFDESIVGGESTFVDGLAAAEELRRIDPTSFHALCRIPATFQKDHVQRADPAKMFYQRPHIHIDTYTGAVVAVFWAPPFEGPLRVENPQDVALYFVAYEKFRAILTDPVFLAKHGVRFRTKPGNLVIFNNRRYLHGREAFSVPVGGSQRRKLHGCYLEMDRVLNRIRFLQDGKNKKLDVTRPGTTSFL